VQHTAAFKNLLNPELSARGLMGCQSQRKSNNLSGSGIIKPILALTPWWRDSGSPESKFD